MDNIRVIISGGGTGGHIFPAIAIANAIKERSANAEILFIGANDRMEMTRVPAAGYPIIGLDVAGLNRKQPWRNLGVIWKMMKGLRRAKEIINDFNPDIAIGVGGYASAPIIRAANSMDIPTLIQEQNSYAGVTNKLLAKKTDKICVAYDNMENYFQAAKIVVTGNPCRQELLNQNISKKEAMQHFGLDPNKKVILVIGGSLGSRTINQSLALELDKLTALNIQVIWQCGKAYLFDLKVELRHKTGEDDNGVIIMDFIDRMDLAYKAADLVVSRAGAGSISELSILAKPAILIPSPNVAEDHQTKNALALVNKNATVMIKDSDAKQQLVDKIIEIVQSDKKMKKLSANISKMAQHNSADRIVDEVFKLIQTKNRN